MKEKELMIGDYVQVSGEVCKVISISYFDIGISDSKEDFYNEHIDNIKPISLTPEILERNGFEFVQQGSLEVAILKMKNRHPITLEYIGWSDGRWSIREHRFVVKYVHELQHALRLCGTNKDIKL